MPLALTKRSPSRSTMTRTPPPPEPRAASSADARPPSRRRRLAADEIVEAQILEKAQAAPLADQHLEDDHADQDLGIREHDRLHAAALDRDVTRGADDQRVDREAQRL